MSDHATTDRADRSAAPDPQVFWSWVGGALRPVAGWLLAVLGIVALLLGYLGTSREAIVAKQIPYVVSGGLAGIALLFLGGALIGTQDVKKYGERIARLENLVADLHTILLEPADEGEAVPVDLDATTELDAAGTAADAAPNGAPRVLVTPSGSTYHAPGCSVVASREDTSSVTLAEAANRELHPCKVCEPLAASAGTRS